MKLKFGQPDTPKKVRELGTDLREDEVHERGVVWSGHLFDYSGYAKVNRELLFRVANSLRVALFVNDLEPEPMVVNPSLCKRLQAHTDVKVPRGAPFLRVYTPRLEERVPKQANICFTMMETERVHKDFITVLNGYYDEVWTPTNWNKRTFEESGLKVPCRVVPLGVDLHTYSCVSHAKRPTGRLLTTSKAGTEEVPMGMGFMTIFQPTFRKGIDVLVAAFERAFRKNPEAASLSLVTGVHEDLERNRCKPFELTGLPTEMKSRIYQVTGLWSERGMARLYSAFDCYASASRGEGWNLPLMEAAACGLSLIASDCSSHTELLKDTDALMFTPDGFDFVNGASRVCRWYNKMPFAKYENGSIDRLAWSFKVVSDSGNWFGLRREAINTWDHSAGIVTERLIALHDYRKGRK